MSTAIVQANRQTTLPAEVCEPAGVKPGDQIDWRFECGEIRGRKLAAAATSRANAKVARDEETGLVYLDAEISDEEIEAAILAGPPPPPL